MLLKTLYHFLRHPSISGITVPFKVYHKAKIHVGKNVTLKLEGRLKVGNDNSLPSVSLLSINLWFDENSTVKFGKSVCIGPGVNLIVKKGAKVSIGSHTYFASDCHIESTNELDIGSNCAISWGVTILDSDHHVITYPDVKEKLNKVHVSDNVWIGCNVTLLKGTSIGKGSVVAAGSIVKGTFPPNSLIGGNPAKLLRTGVSWS